MTFLIAYDIADNRRLRLVAKFLESQAERVQKSVFQFVGPVSHLHLIQQHLMTLIDVCEDHVQSWPVTTTARLQAWHAGIATPGQVVCLIASPEELLLLGGNNDDTPSPVPLLTNESANEGK